MRRLLEETGENTKAGAVDVAIQHYLADLKAKQKVAPQLQDELVEELSTPWIPIERETKVGRDV